MRPKFNRRRIALVSAMTAAVASGCSSIAVHSDARIEVGPYSGTRLAVRETKRSWTAPKFDGEVLFVMYDVPLSFVADTLMLPVDLSRGERKASGVLVQDGR